MKKILLVLLIIFSFILLPGCKGQIDPDTVVGISIEQSTMKDKIKKTEVFKFLDELSIILTYADDTIEYIGFDKTMMSEEDYLSLFSIGVHTVTLKYLELSIQFSIETYEIVETYYKLTIVYPDNTKVLEEISVKWCYSNDFHKNTILQDGETQIINDNKEYLIHISNIPQGYTYNPNIYIVNSENTDVVIKLEKLYQFVEGNGEKNNPFTITEGTYELSFDVLSLQGMKYFAFTPKENGTYTIESLAETKFFTNTSCDPHFGYLGEEIDLKNIDFSANDNNSVNINFKYSFEAEVGKTYYFIVFLSQTTDFPAKFNVSIYR